MKQSDLGKSLDPTRLPAKISLKNVNLKGLKWIWTKKIRVFIATDCLGIFAEFKTTFSPNFVKALSLLNLL